MNQKQTEKTSSDVYLVDGYIPTIGIECHVQLNSRTKLFTAVSNQAQSEANSLVGPLCLGLPGTLPVLNQAALLLAIRAGLALEGKIAPVIHFDRKHYFYPDLPLGYQISQNQRPLVEGGFVSIWSAELQKSRSIELIRAHVEADAGKLTHLSESDISVVDFNRAGAPLLEVVSCPQIHSPREAKAYAKSLYWLMVYAGVCSGNLAMGQVRFDVNVSLARPGADLGTRTEIKNLNSFRFIEQATTVEISRQIEMIESDQPVRQETRGFNETTKTTFAQRSKEDSPDYRYMPDPDLPPVTITEQMIAEARSGLAVLPATVATALEAAGVSPDQQVTTIDHPVWARWLLEASRGQPAAVITQLANWGVGELLYLVKNESDLDWSVVVAAGEDLITLAAAVVAAEINSNQARDALGELLGSESTARDLIDRISQATAAAATDLEAVITAVCQDQAAAVADAKVDPKAIGFLIGQVRQRLPAADPRDIREVLIEKIKGI